MRASGSSSGKSVNSRSRAARGVVDAPGKIVIVGGGAAGFAAAEMLRRQEFRGSIVMLSDDAAPPVDRPNLSKDYLAGSAPEDWLPLRPDSFYAEAGIDLRLESNVASIDTESARMSSSPAAAPFPTTACCWRPAPSRFGCRSRAPTSSMSTYCARLRIAGRSLQSANGARRAVVIGASFIGLEVAAALRARDIEVHVVAPEQRPMERVLGPDMGDFVRALHEEHGVIFHLGDTVVAIDGKRATLKSGGVLEADFCGRRRRRAAAPRRWRNRQASKSTAALR